MEPVPPEGNAKQSSPEALFSSLRAQRSNPAFLLLDYLLNCFLDYFIWIATLRSQ